MNRLQFFLIFVCMFSILACNRTKIEVRNLPENTPIGAQLYLAGNFNNWNPGDANYLMRFDPINNMYYGELPAGFGKINYKITRGDWSSVEVDSCGGEIANRAFELGSEEVLVNYVNGFKDLAPVYCGRLTIVLDEIPMNTPMGSKLFLSGNINYWMLKQRPYEFSKLEDGRYYLTVPRRENKLMFKINRGTWESTEIDENNLTLEPRVVEFGIGDTVHVRMRPWADLPLEKLVTKTIIIQKHPKEAPANCYLAGTINNWNPVDEKYKFKLNKKGQYEVRYTFGENSTEYFKITRGAWEKREIQNGGTEVKNRILTKNGKDTLMLVIENWADKNNKYTALKARNDIAVKSFDNLPNLKANKIENPYKPSKEPLRKIIIIIDKSVDITNPNEKIFLTGDFNDWVTDALGYVFKELPNGKKYFILRLNDKLEHEFKLTRGDWSTEEADINRNKLDNRKIPFGSQDDTIHIKVDSWLDYTVTPRKKLVVAIASLPDNTPPFSNFYLAGNFNGWLANVEAFKFKKQNENYYLSLPKYSEDYREYKVTRGSWETEFTDKKGRTLPNQKFKKKYINDTLYLNIEGWKDLPKY